MHITGWLVCYFESNGLLIQYFSLYRTVFQIERENRQEKKYPKQAHRNYCKRWLVGWLFWVSRPFETVFQSISGRLPKRGRNRRKDR